jgi:hypothetical protein
VEKFQAKVIKKIKAHISENHAVYEIMWKNTVKPDRTLITT